MSATEASVLEVIDYINEMQRKGKPVENLADGIANLFRHIPEAMVHDPQVRMSLSSYVDMVTIALDNPFIATERKAAIEQEFAPSATDPETPIARIGRLIHEAETHPRPYHRTLGAGSFGYVVQPAFPNVTEKGNTQVFPQNVTKVFYDKKAYEDALATSRKVGALLGHNEGHRVNTYHHAYTAKNVAPYISQALQDQYKRAPNAPLMMMRMPHLGIDIRAAITQAKHRPVLRQIPIGVVVAQIKKLVQQTRSIVANGYIHMDVRDSNVMIDPTTGVMTLIDFDWLKPVKEIFETYPFGFYNNPPETLLLSRVLDIAGPTTCTLPPSEAILSTLPSGPDKEFEKHRRRTFNSFQKYLVNHFTQVMARRGLNEPGAMMNETIRMAVCRTTMPALVSAGFLKEPFRVFRDQIAPTFDNYGLGLTLLEYFLHTYPGCLESKATFRENLRTRITDRGRSYTDAELDVIVSVLQGLAALFNAMSSFALKERPTPDAVVARVTELEARLGPGPGSGAAGGQAGGRHRKTRRHRRRRQTSVGRGKGAPRSG